MKFILLMANGNALSGHSHAMVVEAASKEEAEKLGYFKLKEVLDKEVTYHWDPKHRKEVCSSGLSYLILEDTEDDLRKSCANALRKDATLVPFN